MGKHISQKQAFHYIYIGKVKNDIDGSCCGYFKDGLCLRDNSACMADSYCKQYNTNIQIYDVCPERIENIDVYTLEYFYNGEKEILEVYFSEKSIDDNFNKFNPDAPLREEVFAKPIGHKFRLNGIDYTIKNVCSYVYKGQEDNES